MRFIALGESRDLCVSYMILDELDDEIGSVEGYLSNSGELISVVKIFKPEKQQQGLGFKAFKKIYDELCLNMEIKTIIGSWHAGGEFQDFENGMSTNLKCFHEALNAGKSKEASAFSTPTGKWARRLGYTKCLVGPVSTEGMTVRFTKEDNSNFWRLGQFIC